MSHLPAHFDSQSFWTDKQNEQISETPYYTWYHGGSHTKCTDHKTSRLLKTGWTRRD